ncbi:MAG: flagellar biosynthetic protein FliQ [Planctomycetota bacterium]|jgi:flagellar biosynthetic protein FliQ
MDEGYVVNLAREAFLTAIWVAGPAMIVGMLIGILMAIFQAITSVQEQTLTMIPKILAVGMTIVLMMPYILKTLGTFTTDVFRSLVDAAL